MIIKAGASSSQAAEATELVEDGPRGRHDGIWRNDEGHGRYHGDGVIAVAIATMV
jgi:hypothetical protein